MSVTKHAEGTKVPIEQSQAELRKLLRAKGCDAIAFYEEGDARAVIAFERKGRRVRLTLKYPPLKDYRYYPGTYRSRPSENAIRVAWEAECRRLWRVLIVLVRGNFEAEDSGLVSFEQVWLAHMLLPGGETVADRVLPALDTAQETGQLPPLLPGAGPSSGVAGVIALPPAPAPGPGRAPTAPTVRIREG